MKLKLIFATALLSGSTIISWAQTHQEGVEYYRADQVVNAKELLERNYKNAGTDQAISEYYLGLIAMDYKEYNDALNHFNKGISINPEYPYNYVGLGELDLKNGNKSAAEKQFKMALSKAKKDASLDIAIARAYYNTNPIDYTKEIEKYLNDARKHSPKEGTAPTNTDIYLFEGDRKRDNKDFGGAGNQYEMATTYNPNATEAYVKYAELFTDVNPQYAINMLQKLLEVNPTSALGQRELANAYYNAQKYKEAASQYEKYVKNPNHFKQDEDRLSFLLFVDGDYQGGYDFATSLLKSNPNNFTAKRFQFMNAAQIDSMKDLLLPMAESLLADHKANPDNKFAPVDYNLIGEELLNADRPQDAQALFEEAIAQDPENPEYYRYLAQVFVKEKDYVKTANAYDQYIQKKKEPGYNDIVQQARYDYYAGASNLTENPQLAISYLNKANEIADQALAISADYPTPYVIKGQTAIALANTDNERESAAVPFYSQAIDIIEASENPSRYASDLRNLYTYMGNYYLKQKNDKNAALSYYDKYLELNPSDQQIVNYVNTLRKGK